MANYYRETIDAGLLIVAFFVGFSTSIALKKIGEFPDWLPAVTSGIVIIAYVIIAHLSKRARLDPGQIGDNAYYLGFVLTLASLAFTLYELAGSEIKDSNILDDVIAGFGIALSSTIVGVLARVALLQYRVDLVANEREIKLKLNDAMRRFHAEVEDMVRGTKYLGIEIRQSLDEYHNQKMEKYGQSVDMLVGNLSSGHKEVLDGIIKQTKDANNELVSNTRSSISNVEKAVIETLDTVSAHMQETNVSINEGIQSTADILKRNLQETSELMSGTLNKLQAELRNSTSEISRIQKENMKREANLIGEAETSMRSIGSFAETISDAEKAILETLNAISGQLQETRDAMINIATHQSTNAINEMLQVQTENMKRETAESMKPIRSLTKRYDDSLNQIETSTKKLSDASEQANKKIGKITKNLERLNNQVSNKIDNKPERKFWKFRI
ncbi:MAG: hypothetical protein OXC66_07615 [Roseovarius sp.]|nr:hypothetical protein [Roseovarius sp.]